VVHHTLQSGIFFVASYTPYTCTNNIIENNTVYDCNLGDVYLDEKFPYHLQSFYDAGAMTAAYWYCDSRWYTNRQFTTGGVKSQVNEKHPILQTILQGLRSGNTGWKAVRILFFDVEDASAGGVWNTLYIEDLRERLVNLQRQTPPGAPPNMLLGIYSRAGFIESQIELQTWVENHPEIVVWTANYLTAYPGKHMPIADYKTNSLPLVTQKPRWFGDNPSKPKLYKRFWQYHGTFDGAMYSTCPEIMGSAKPAGLDLNMFEGTRAEMWEMVGLPDPLTVVEPPPPPPPVDPPPSSDIEARVKALEDRINKHLLP